MRSLGIDIGRYSIKVVEILANNRSYEITNAKEYKILNLETSNQEIDILQTLNTISKEFDTETAKVTCSIRQQYVSTRKLFFPFKERVKIHKSLAFELEDDMPLSVEKSIYDSKIIKFHDKTAEVIAMACVGEEVERTLDIFERGHIDPDIITPEFAALANLYEKWYKSPEEVNQEELEKQPDRLVVHIGHSKSFVGVVSNGFLIWGRSIMWGIERVASSISKSFQVPFTTALDMMPSKAFVLLSTSGANKDQVKMSDAVTEALQPLIQDLRLSMMLANTEYGANIEQIEMIGGPAHIKNLAGFFTQELERPTNVVNPIKSLSGQHMKNHERLADVFVVSIGLAIEGLRRPFNPPVNFRQGEMAKKNLSFEKFWEKWGYTTKIVTAAYIIFCIYGVAYDSIATQLELASYDVMTTQATKIAKIKTRTGIESKIRSYIRKNKKKAELVSVYDQLEEINSPLKFVNDVSQTLPSNKDTKAYEIRRFVVDNTKVNIQGVAADSKTIEKINRSLKGLAAGGKVKAVPAVIQKEEGRQVFGFEFLVKRKN